MRDIAPVHYDFDPYPVESVRLQVVGPNLVNNYRVVVSAGDEILAETLPTDYYGAHLILGGLVAALHGTYCRSQHCPRLIAYVDGAGYEDGEMAFFGYCEVHK